MSSGISLIATGDAILVLGEGADTVRVRVSAAILSCTSPVFEALLNSKYQEGQGERSSAQPKDIVLAENLSTAMLDLCSVLHHNRQSDLASVQPSTQASLRVLELCVEADKYGCVDAVKLPVEALFYRFYTTISQQRPTPSGTQTNLISGLSSWY